MEIAIGTGGTLKSTTYESQIQELAAFCAIAQRDEVKNPEALDYFQVQSEDYGSQVNIAFSFPLEKTPTQTGFDFTAPEYLAGSGFTPGTGGDIDITTTTGYFYKLILTAQDNEAPLSETNVNRISGNYNIDTGLFTGSCTFETTQAIGSAGQVCTFVTEYIPEPTP